MVKGILADINAIGQIEALVHQMQAEPWGYYWTELGLVLNHFADVGLSVSSSDREIWQKCQAEQLVLVTDNRNLDTADSLEATIRQFNTPDALPVFTIGDMDKFRQIRDYAERVLIQFYEYLIDIDAVRGTGRLYLP